MQIVAPTTPDARDNMLMLGALTLGLLFIANQRLHASYLHPACLFNGLWFALLSGLILAGEAFNPISDVTILIYMSGALSFTLGGTLVTRSAVGTPNLTRAALETRRINHMIDSGICISIALVPFYWSRLSMIAEISAHRVFLAGVRAAMVENQSETFGVFTYVLPAGLLLSLIAAAIDDGTRRARVRTIAISLITLGYYVSTGSRLGSELTLIGVAVIGCVRSRRLYLSRLFWAGALLLVIFTVPAILLNKGGNSRLSISDNAGNVAGSARLYLLGGLVAFDQIVTGNAPYIRPEYSLRPLYRVAQALDSSVEVPPQNLPFTQVPEVGNIYTIYCGYYVAFGWPGICIAMLTLGIALASIYERARAGSSQATVFYGLGAAFILISGAADSFLSGITFCIEATLFVAGLFFLARITPRRHKLEQTGVRSFVMIRSNLQSQRESAVRCLPLE